MKNILIIALLLFLLPANAYSDTYWVDTSGGAASWAACEGASDVGSGNRCSMALANSYADAGDTINIITGTYDSYNEYIKPVNSGSSGSEITWQTSGGDVTITGQAYGIYLDGVDYHIFDGFIIKDTTSALVVINNGSDHNEIKNCTITNGPDLGNSGIQIKDDSQDDGGSKYNWLHDNTFALTGYIPAGGCDDSSYVMKIGGAGTLWLSGYNTIEDNTFYSGGHHLLETHTRYNVIRNNVFHNEGWMDSSGSTCTMQTGYNGYYGNRNIQIYHDGTPNDMYNLLEDNRIGWSDYPPDDQVGENISITSKSNIFRYNFSYAASGDGIYFKDGAQSANNRVYNNTFYYNGIGTDWAATRPNMANRRNSVTFTEYATGNILKNNISYAPVDQDFNCIGGGCLPTDLNTLTNNWENSDGDPKFTDPDVTDRESTTKPDLSLQSSSGAINQGTYLTQANGSGASSTTLIVDDALYFQDGTWGSDLDSVQADYIAIGSLSKTVQISSINYSTNTITLASVMDWSDNDNIYLYKKSDGDVVYYGALPDQGASEYDQSDVSGTPLLGGGAPLTIGGTIVKTAQ